MPTPVKTPRHSRSSSSDSCKSKGSENLQPNIPICTSSKKQSISPACRSSAKPRKLVDRSLCPTPPPPPPVRKVILEKKRNTKTKENEGDPKKPLEAAYEKDIVLVLKAEESKNGEERVDEFNEKKNLNLDLGESGSERKIKSILMEEAMNSIPEPGSGRVRYLVEAFENLLFISDTEESGKDERKPRMMDFILPALPPKAEETNDCPSPKGLSSVELFPFRECGRNSRHCSLDGLECRLSLVSRISSGSRRSRGHSLDSLQKSWNKKLKVTSQKPFKLRTELRGRAKEQKFIKKVTEMLTEEKKKRIPIAQGLPWTTDEPECLVKPPVKECTEPLDIVLHSDVRAVERAEFDYYVAEKLEFVERLRLERERQQQMKEEEEIKRIRRELVPRAQLMPYFDRPFFPKKSTKSLTVPKEPNFHTHPSKASWVEISQFLEKRTTMDALT